MLNIIFFFFQGVLLSNKEIIIGIILNELEVLK